MSARRENLHTKVSDEICSQRIRCPFSVHNVLVRSDIEAKLLETLSSVLSVCSINNPTSTYPAEGFQSALGVIYLLDPSLGLVEATLEVSLERLKPRVEFDDACHR